MIYFMSVEKPQIFIYKEFMPLTKQDKKKLLTDLTQKITDSKSVVITSYHKLKVKDMQDLRRKLKEKNLDLKVVKNTLFKKVLNEKKIEIADNVLNKPLACVFGQDEVEPAKIVFDFSKSNENLKILGALLESEFIDKSKVDSLAKLPTKQELYGQVVLRIKSPLSGFVNVLRGNLSGLVSVLKQYQEKIS